MGKELTEAFVATCSTIRQSLGDQAFKPKRAVNAALSDALMVAVASRLERTHHEARRFFATGTASYWMSPSFERGDE